MAPSLPGTQTRLDPRRPEAAARRAAVAALLGVLSLTLHLTLAWELDRLGTFEKKDALFDADIATRLEALSSGRHLGIKHPNLMPYFTPPITLAAKVLARAYPAGGTEAELQRTLGVLVVPVASSVKTVLLFYLFSRLGLSVVRATVATLLALVSFTTLVFGSIPESYGLTALAMAMAYTLAATPGGPLTWRRVTLWIAIGVFATGITLTNVVFVALLFWAACGERRLVSAGVRVAVVALAILGVTAVSAYVLDLQLVRPDPGASGGVVPRSTGTVLDRVVAPIQNQLATHHDLDDSPRKLRYFPTALANAFAPPRLERVPIDFRGRQHVGFTLEHSPSIFGRGDPLGLSVILLLVAGAACALAAPPVRRIAAASVGMILVGWLFSVWGTETHLFSQHWHLPAVVLIAGLMTVRGYGALMAAVLATLTFAIAVNNAMILRGMLALLSASVA